MRGHFQWPRNKVPTDGSFVGKMRARTGLATFDAPMEAQWEYANRCGSKSGRHSCYKEENIRCGLPDANIDYGCDLSGGTTTVGSYPPNVWGLYEMFGNVAEYCLDAMVGESVLCDYYGALMGLPEDERTYDKVVVNDPEGPPLANTFADDSEWKKYESKYEAQHVMRGASWYHSIDYCTHFHRFHNENFKGAATGIRFVVTCE